MVNPESEEKTHHILIGYGWYSYITHKQLQWRELKYSLFDFNNILFHQANGLIYFEFDFELKHIWMESNIERQ